MRIRVIRPASRQNAGKDFMETSAKITHSYASKGTEIETVFIDGGAKSGPMVGHANEARIMANARPLIREVIQAERDGWDAVMLSGEYDVGADIARHMVKIPVIDTANIGLRVAHFIGDRTCLLVIEDSVLAFTKKVLRQMRASELVHTMRTWNIPLEQVWERRHEVKPRTLDICRDAIEKDRVNVFLPFCAVYTPFIVDTREIEDEIGVPVINAVALAVKTTEMFVDLRLNVSRDLYPLTPAEVWTP